MSDKSNYQNDKEQIKIPIDIKKLLPYNYFPHLQDFNNLPNFAKFSMSLKNSSYEFSKRTKPIEPLIKNNPDKYKKVYSIEVNNAVGYLDDIDSSISLNHINNENEICISNEKTHDFTNEDNFKHIIDTYEMCHPDKDMWIYIAYIYVFYKTIYHKTQKYKKEIIDINDDKHNCLRIDDHGKSHNNNYCTTRINGSFYNDSTEHSNIIFFEQFYTNFCSIENIAINIIIFIEKCLKINKFPIFFKKKCTSYDFNAIINDSSENKIIIMMIDRDFNSTYGIVEKNEKNKVNPNERREFTNKLYQPLRIQLSKNNGKYRLQYDNDTKFLNYDEQIEKGKSIEILKAKVDHKKSTNQKSKK
jgi:hypothetical protein